MAQSYYYNNKGQYRTARDHHSTSLLDDLRAFVAYALRSLARWWRERGRYAVWEMARGCVHRVRLNMTRRRVLSFPHLLVAVWVVVLLWGERWVFRSKVESCEWGKWESWVGCRLT